ncbi:hypothetical protein SA496_15745 [Pseudomonas sp. JS3066]|uniref:hypothetical protein n=1 Tax=Pseudomonas sp. JS3066 TaxID=3090665 RepID=UPI002E7B4653|nr:hypothetical protein [Pseudomonas sp. JS3066]WVK91182.1 hypothetical protein SA496_15745 [Pseudomonas sp. JS3066]
MADAHVMKCTIHNLRFEQPDDWHERKLPAGGCYLCMADQLKAAQKELAEVTNQRDTLLAAIDVKLTVQVPGFD